MIRSLLFSISILLATNAFSQNTNLGDYSYVIVPEQMEFLKGKDQWQINSMTKFYFDKNGFNAYLADSAPNSNRCDGLYANVEELPNLFGTKLQLVLRDCKDKEVYRGPEAKSKYKEHEKAYQDALRKSFSGLEIMRVHQKDVILLATNPNTTIDAEETEINSESLEISKPKVSRISGNLLPDAKFSNYSNSGKTFLLRKTSEGYSLYEESSSAEDGLLLKGKIIVMDQIVKYMDTAGKVSDAAFDTSGNLIIKADSSSIVYKSEN